MSQIKIRKATSSDSEILFEWANDPITRSNSFNSGNINWEDHLKWFKNQLTNNSNYIYIAFDLSDSLIGTIRIETTTEETIIGVTIAPEKRGLGFASSIIKLACHEFWKTNNNVITAYIKIDNSTSTKAFKKAGFYFLSTTVYKGIPCFIYKIKK